MAELKVAKEKSKERKIERMKDEKEKKLWRHKYLKGIEITSMSYKS